MVSQYHRFWLWPVYDDDTGRLDYWDIHEPTDPRGEGNPIAEGLSTKADAQAWIRQHLRDTALERTLERAFTRLR